jgi:hypothetical protein
LESRIILLVRNTAEDVSVTFYHQKDILSMLWNAAQPLVKNTPTGSLTDGANISINPKEPLPANGTVSISTERATDTDMNVILPEGVSVIISSDTVTVTNQEVDIATAGEDETDGDEEGEAFE